MQTRAFLRKSSVVAAFSALVGVASLSAEAGACDCSPCIDLFKTGPATALPGDEIVYEFTVKNCGNVLLGGGAVVYDKLLNGTEPIWSGDLTPGQEVTFFRKYIVPKEACGEIVNTAEAVGVPDESNPACADAPKVTDADSHSLMVKCEGGNGLGTGTPGYWKNHPEAWPVESIIIGSVTYTRAEAIALLKTPEKGDKSLTLFRALLAARLNVLIGNNSSCVATTIKQADKWLAQYGPAGSDVSGSSAAWKLGEPLYLLLDQYNNGGLCAPHRD